MGGKKFKSEGTEKLELGFSLTAAGLNVHGLLVPQRLLVDAFHMATLMAGPLDAKEMWLTNILLLGFDRLAQERQYNVHFTRYIPLSFYLAH